MSDIEKGLEKDLKSRETKVFENDIFNLKVDFAGNPNSLEDFSNLWEDLVKRNIETEKIIGTSEGTFYYMKLYSDRGYAYIDLQLRIIEQLRILGGRL